MATVNQTPTMLLPCPGRDAVFATFSPSCSGFSEPSCRVSPLSTKHQALHHSSPVFCCFRTPVTTPRDAAALAFPASPPLSFASHPVHETPYYVSMPSL